MTDGSTSRQQTRHSGLDSSFQVGVWLADPGLNLIRDPERGDQRHLEPRLMKLLCFLAANSGAVITREELVNLLWPRVIVNENSLTRAISELRKQLDSPAMPGREVVQTIPKRGYRLNVPVRPLPPQPEAHQSPAPTGDPATSQQPGEPARRPRGSVLARTLGSIFRMPERALAATASAGFCLMLGLNIAQQPGSPVLSGPTAQLGDELVYSETVTELPVNLSTFNLSRLDASDRSVAGIPPSSAIDTPVLSPDRERFAFIERNLTASSIYVGKTGGESVSEFTPVEVLSVPYRLSNLTWSPVGNALLFARHKDLAPAVMFGDSNQRSELMRLDLDSGSVSRLVEDQQMPADATPREANLTFLEPYLQRDTTESFGEKVASQTGGSEIPKPAIAPAPLPFTPA